MAFKNLHNHLPLSMIIAIVLFILALPFMLGIWPTVRFTREQIDIDVYPAYITVKGRYVYENPFPFPVVQGFSIPFHLDLQHPPPVYVDAAIVSPVQEDIPIRYLMGVHRFDLAFTPNEKKEVVVSYRQAAPEKSGCYLLRTSKPWKRPLLKGSYRLMLNGVKVVSSTYPLKPIQKNVVAFSRINFMPEIDWQWKWKLAKK